jgi:hypothetical protein
VGLLGIVFSVLGGSLANRYSVLSVPSAKISAVPRAVPSLPSFMFVRSFSRFPLDFSVHPPFAESCFTSCPRIGTANFSSRFICFSSPF